MTDEAIRNLLRREPMPGRMRFRYEREPDYWLGCAAMGEDSRVLVAREPGSHEVAGLVCRSTRQVFINAKRAASGLPGAVCVLISRFRGQWLVSRGFSQLKQLQGAHLFPAYLLSIGPKVIDTKLAFWLSIAAGVFRFFTRWPIAVHWPFSFIEPKWRCVRMRRYPRHARVEVVRFLNRHGACLSTLCPSGTQEGFARLAAFGKN